MRRVKEVRTHKTGSRLSRDLRWTQHEYTRAQCLLYKETPVNWLNLWLTGCGGALYSQDSGD